MANCVKCGAALQEGAKFCIGCGLPVGEMENCAPETAPATEATGFDKEAAVEKAKEAAEKAKVVAGATAKKLKKLPADTLSLIVGTLLIIVGFIQLTGGNTTISSTSFGGDFYTYTYRGIVAISQLLSHLNKSVAWLIIGMGASIDLKVLNKRGK